MNIISKTFESNKLPNSILCIGKDNRIKLEAIIYFIKHFYQNSDISKRIDHHSFLDLKIIDKQDDVIKIDDIREVIHFVHLSPIESKAKFIVIVNADRMNLNAANSLLKILEEPPANNYIFLIAENAEGLPKTISSRCVKLNFESNIINEPTEQRDILNRTNIINNDLKEFLEHYKKFANLIQTGKSSDIMTYINNTTSKTAGENWNYFTQAFLFLISKLAAGAENNDRESISQLLSLYDKAIKLFAEEKRLNLDRKTVALTLINKLKQQKEEV